MELGVSGAAAAEMRAGHGASADQGAATGQGPAPHGVAVAVAEAAAVELDLRASEPGMDHEDISSSEERARLSRWRFRGAGSRTEAGTRSETSEHETPLREQLSSDAHVSAQLLPTCLGLRRAARIRLYLHDSLLLLLPWSHHD